MVNLEQYHKVRNQTLLLCEHLSSEDCQLQSMPDASPAKWHLAHTTWFFEAFLLNELPGYRPFSLDFQYLFNSYYNSLGERHPRHQRGLLSRPNLTEILQYRSHVDAAIADYTERKIAINFQLLELGLHHEQQHQELLLTDIKHALSCNPLYPKYAPPVDGASPGVMPHQWLKMEAGLFEFGSAGGSFCFDNETPLHRGYLHNFAIANRSVTNEEYLQFIQDGGYQRPELWLSDGWYVKESQQWQAPMYWIANDTGWESFTLHGRLPINPHEPVCHISYYEADAYARWAGGRLPTEFEWEHAARSGVHAGNFLESGQYHPAVQVMHNFFGDIWEWTSSAYSAYPGYQPLPGAVGEYNGKFMCNQFVLRGGSCLTPSSHIRPTYRNFFHPDKRWQMTGIRLVKNL
ncbi:MAG: ergothioneine biosynthesis protein EgtB [Zavarzinella sp.]